jgi:B12-binding domain/radical SAM domain protein
MRKPRGELDLLLLHAPSVYDFRERAILYGPVSDMVPSSTVFEMYPLGFLTIASYLHDRGLEVRIVNLALRMMNSRRFDVPKFLGKLRPKAIGIDLHWLPHAHGALEVARIAKQLHPNVPVIMGGLSSTYFHRELIGYSQVDYVLRGDSTEPPLHQLLLALESGAPLDDIPNLVWKDARGIHVNPLSFMPKSLDYVDLRPDLMVEMVMRHRDLESTLPFNGWWNNPITTVFTVKGCAFECVTCGSSASACLHVTTRQKPVYRGPASLVSNMQDIARLTHAPILLVGDLLMAGPEHAADVLERLRIADLPNNIVFEFFALPAASFLRDIDRCVRNWSMEFSPESHEQVVRDAQDGESGYTTEDMENLIKVAASLRCSRIDIFFMIGLPAQTQTSVQATVEYCGHLFKLGDKRLSCFISPMGPFIDPGSRGFEQPERFGYRLFAKTLEQHRQLLIKPTWEYILNYETKWMTRRELVDATYDAAERLNELKIEHGRLSARRGRGVAAGIAAARALRARLDEGMARGDIGTVTEQLKGEINRFSVSTVCDKRELFWPRRVFNFRLSEIARIVGRYFSGRTRAPVTADPPS